MGDKRWRRPRPLRNIGTIRDSQLKADVSYYLLKKKWKIFALSSSSRNKRHVSIEVSIMMWNHVSIE